MTLEKWQTVCQIAIFVGAVLASAGGLGSWKLEQLINQRREQEVRKKEQEQKQEAVLEKKKSATAGVLVSEDEILLSPNRGIYPLLQVGGTLFSWEGPTGKPLFKFDGSDITIIKRLNRVLVSVKILGANGIVIAELVENEWKINPNNSFDRNYSEKALEVKNPEGQIILQAEALTDRIKFQGIFYGPDSTGSGLIVNPKDGGAQIIFFRGAITKYDEIAPMFKYPSELHFGELR